MNETKTNVHADHRQLVLKVNQQIRLLEKESHFTFVPLFHHFFRPHCKFSSLALHDEFFTDKAVDQIIWVFQLWQLPIVRISFLLFDLVVMEHHLL